MKRFGGDRIKAFLERMKVNDEDAVIKTVGYSEETRGNIILPKFKHNYLPDVEKVQKVFDWATAKGLLTKDITAKDVLNNVATK